MENQDKFVQYLKYFIIYYLVLHHNIEDIDDILERQIYEYIFENLEDIEKCMTQMLLTNNEQSFLRDD